MREINDARDMRYLVNASLKSGQELKLLEGVGNETLGQGSVAGDEYVRNMKAARLLDDGTVSWVEVCFCNQPLAEERPYWEAFFRLNEIKDAHARRNCRDLNGQEPWACMNCTCTEMLEKRLQRKGQSFLDHLKKRTEDASHEKRGDWVK